MPQNEEDIREIYRLERASRAAMFPDFIPHPWAWIDPERKEMAKENFPQVLYVQAPISGDPEKNPYEGYKTYADAQEDDTIAIYSLERVCRVKIERKTVLIDEPGRTWPCRSLPKDQWCDNLGSGGFMGHTCDKK